MRSSVAVRRSHPLKGVRLGKMERHLLLLAPDPKALFGLELDDSDRSVRQNLQRASLKLKRVGLLERETMQVYMRARDPRRERLLFRDGRFYRRTDPSRAHAVRRTVVWQSPFGFEIVLRYRTQLEAGTAIRWDARTVERARSLADQLWVDRLMRRAQIEEKQEEARDAVILAHPSEGNLDIVVPHQVASDDDLERWELAVALAHHRDPELRDDALWERAVGLYDTTDLESLRAAAAEFPRPDERRSRAEDFRRRPRRELSRSMSDQAPLRPGSNPR